MKLCKLNRVFLIGLILIIVSGCTFKKKQEVTDLAMLNLLRGEIVICSSDEFGEVSFLVSCSYETRESFELAISLLHSFEYDEAEKAFTQVLDSDPSCVMAYWGVAMSILNHPKYGPSKDDFNRAVRVLKYANSMEKTPREQKYFNAVNAYYNNDWDATAHLERAEKMEVIMEQIYKMYPEDKEAAIFYSLSLFATAKSSDKEYVKQLKAGTILKSIFPNQPDHPGIAHYIIHHYDYPELAKLALPTARRYAEIAPGSAHAQHMPSHIFTRLGLWDESIASNVNSASSAYCYAGETGMDGHWSRELHALDYLVYAYLQKGDNENAMQQYEYAKSIDKIVPATASYNFGAISSRIYLENKMWKEASQLRHHPSNVDWDNSPWALANLHFARVLGASHINNIISAEKDLEVLKSLYKALEGKYAYRAKQVLIQVKAAEAWVKYAKGDKEEAILLMELAANLEEETGKHPVTPGEVLPAIELLGDMYLAIGNPTEALKSYEVNLKRSPNRFNGIYGAAVASKESGDTNKAEKYFMELMELTKNSNSDRRELLEARKYLEDNKKS